MKTFLSAVTVAASLAFPALALDYKCEISDIGDGFIGGTVYVRVEPGNDTGMVYDEIIHMVHGEPIEARLTDRGNGEFRLRYRVFNIPATPTPATISYTLTLDTEKNTLLIWGNIPGAANSVRGRGTCALG